MNRKHIVLIVSDQHRGDLTGVGGNPWIDTPNLDALASRGVHFASAYCNSPLCGPSRMSFLTGLLPTRTNVHNNRQSLASHIPTIAHAMGAAGYRTVLCGRMHFIGPDQRHGFHERLVGDHGPTDVAFRENPFGAFDGTTGQNLRALQKSGAGVSPVMLYDDEVIEAAVRRLADHDDEAPLFLVVGLYGPHNPYVCEPSRYARYRAAIPDLRRSDLTDFYAQAHPGLRYWIETRDFLDAEPEDLNRCRAGYYGLVERVDELVGRTVDAVDRYLGLDNAVISYTSDHGDMAGEHGLFFKSNMCEGAVRVPWVTAGSGVSPGATLETPVSLIDLAPTLLELAGAPPLPETDGTSLARSVREGGEPPARPVVSMLADMRCGPSVMVRHGEAKLVRYHRLDSADCSPDAAALDLERFVPHEWSGAELDRMIRLQSVRSEMIRAWAGNSPAIVFSSTAPEVADHWQVDVERVYLNNDG
ncbi:MAG: sulfatase-like hydrolase/transferase [bacterium]